MVKSKKSKNLTATNLTGPLNGSLTSLTTINQTTTSINQLESKSALNFIDLEFKTAYESLSTALKTSGLKNQVNSRNNSSSRDNSARRSSSHNNSNNNSQSDSGGDTSQSIRLKINSCLSKLCHRLSECQVDHENVQLRLTEYCDSLQRVVKQLPEGNKELVSYKTGSFDVLLLKYNLALGFMLNGCPKAAISTLKSTIRKTEERKDKKDGKKDGKRDGRNDGKNLLNDAKNSVNDQKTDQSPKNNDPMQKLEAEMFEQLLSRSKQLACEAYLELDDLASARSFIQTEITNETQNSIQNLSQTTDSSQFLSTPVNLEALLDLKNEPSNSKKVKQLETMFNSRFELLRAKKEEISDTWRLLYTRLSLKDKSTDFDASQMNSLKNGSYGLFYMSHLEFIKGNRTKARAMLKMLGVEDITDSESSKVEHLQLKTRQLNNLGIIEFCEGNINRSMLTFSKAYQHLQQSATSHHTPKNLPTEGTRTLNTALKVQRKTAFSLAYNYAIANLFEGHHQKAFEILTQNVVLQYPTSPRIWLRIAQCCISAHLDSSAESTSYDKTVVDESASRTMTQLTNMDFSNARAKSVVTDDGDSGMDSDSKNNPENSDSKKTDITGSKTSDSKPEMSPTYQDSDSSLEYGASAIRNTLRLLVRIEAKGKEFGMSCRPGGPLTNSGHHTLKIHALLAGAYIQLQLQNWVVALEYCDQVLLICSEDYYLCWLCYTYQATAYLNLNKPSKAASVLTEAISLVMERDGFRDCQAKLYDSKGVSTSDGRGGKGGVCAAKVTVSDGTERAWK